MSSITLHTENGDVAVEASQVVRIFNNPPVCTVQMTYGDMIHVRDSFDNTLDKVQAYAEG